MRVNTLREICNVDMLIAPAAMNAGDIYEGSYTAAQLQALLMGGGVKFYTKDATGAEIKDVVRCLVEGCGRDDDPISWDTLPASSGFTMKISRDDKGNMHLEDILKDGKSVEDEKYILSVMLTFLVILCWNVHIIMICQSMTEFICIRLRQTSGKAKNMMDI